MKILVGIHKKTKVLSLILILRSTITILKSGRKGLTFIHQELNLYPELTVLDNLFVGKEQKQNRNTK